jgi:hypothetical protein
VTEESRPLDRDEILRCAQDDKKAILLRQTPWEGKGKIFLRGAGGMSTSWKTNEDE